MGDTYSPQQGDFTAPGATNGITDYINNSSNVGRTAVQTIASETISRSLEAALKAKDVAGASVKAGLVGALVQPAVWVLSGKAPQPEDIALWGLGVGLSLTMRTIGGAATIATGFVKAALEDHEDKVIATAVQKEPEKYRPFITSVRNYGGLAGRGIVAMTIASHGGVTWRVSEAIWVYITDAKGRLVCDYKPAFAYEIYGPDLPLRIAGREGDKMRFPWRRYPGTHIG
jgi:hypothetical protein